VTAGDPEGSELSNQRAGRIVVGVDGSADSMRALAWAAAEARLRESVLEVVHVDFFRREALEAFAPDVLSDERTVLQRAVDRAKALEPSIAVVGRLCEPPAGKALIEASEGADMLVVGSRGLSGLKKLALGSVSSECVHHGRCPVVVLRPGTPERTAGQPGAEATPVPNAVSAGRGQS